MNEGMLRATRFRDDALPRHRDLFYGGAWQRAHGGYAETTRSRRRAKASAPAPWRMRPMSTPQRALRTTRSRHGAPCRRSSAGR